MLFKNTRTGKIVDAFGVTGDEWEPIKEPVQSPVLLDEHDDSKKTKPKRKKAVK